MITEVPTRARCCKACMMTNEMSILKGIHPGFVLERGNDQEKEEIKTFYGDVFFQTIRRQVEYKPCLAL